MNLVVKAEIFFGHIFCKIIGCIAGNLRNQLQIMSRNHAEGIGGIKRQTNFGRRSNSLDRVGALKNFINQKQRPVGTAG